MRDDRSILAGTWMLALLAVAFVACSSPAAAPVETESAASAPVPTSPPGTIPSADAVEYIGDKVTVCGPVVNTRNEVSRTGSWGGEDQTEISLDFDQPYPDQTFLVVIYPPDEKNYDVNPVEFYKDKEVCATGRIDNVYGTGFMRAYEPTQLEVMP